MLKHRTRTSSPLGPKVERRITLARLAVFWENLWPRLVVSLSIIGLFIAISWLGLWLVLPVWLKLSVVGLFGLGFLASLGWLARTSWPSREAAIRRIEVANGLIHRPISALLDQPAALSATHKTREAWEHHQQSLKQQLTKYLTPGWPKSSLNRLDPFMTRGALILLLYVSWGMASGERWLRLGDAFTLDTRTVQQHQIRVDAWITPPLYTEAAPIYLRSGQTDPQAENDLYKIPVGSTLTIRVSGNQPEDSSISLSRNLKDSTETTEEAIPPSTEDKLTVFNLAVEADQTLKLRQAQETHSQWAFSVIPDQAPRITWEKAPEQTPGQGILFSYAIEEDYPGLSGSVIFTQEDAGSEQATDQSLYDAPTARLTIPSLAEIPAKAETRRSFIDHPWAGSTLSVYLEITDAAGQTARTDSQSVTLPARVFNKPVAKALVEQRRILALNKTRTPHVIRALDALTIAPNLYVPSVKVYLGLSFLRKSLSRAQTDDELREVADAMWAMALTLENGALGDAERDLKTAQEALRQALERNASDEEIKKLTDQLREAMNQYLSELAQRMAKINPQSTPQDNQRTLRNDDLDRILDQIQRLAQSGSQQQAQQLLNELQDLLSSLNRMTAPTDPQTAELLKQLEELSNIIRQQQSLRDKTYQSEQSLKDGEKRAESNEDALNDLKDQLQKALKSLEGEQRDLKEDLSDLAHRLSEQSGRPQGPGQEFNSDSNANNVEPGTGLGSAEQSMRDAERALGKGRSKEALKQQEQALSALREQAQQLTDALAEAARQNAGGLRPDQSARDPLGRPREDGKGNTPGINVKVPDKIDIQKAREILRELRKRYSQPDRPQIELDYLKRLLGK